jgi:hypothetical protein
MVGKDNYVAVHRGSYNMPERGKKAVCISASDELDISIINQMY